MSLSIEWYNLIFGKVLKIERVLHCFQHYKCIYWQHVINILLFLVHTTSTYHSNVLKYYYITCLLDIKIQLNKSFTESAVFILFNFLKLILLLNYRTNEHVTRKP